MSWIDSLISTLSANGVYDVGIEGAKEPPVDWKYATVVPRELKIEDKVIGKYDKFDFDSSGESKGNATEETKGPRNVKNAYVVYKYSEVDNQVVYFVDKSFYKIYQRPAINARAAHLIINANKTWINALFTEKGWDPKFKPYFFGVIIAQVMHGLLDADDDAEWDFKTEDSKIEGDDEKILASIEPVYNNCLLLIAASIINHWKINHTIGTKGIDGFVRKVMMMIKDFEAPPNLDIRTRDLFHSALKDMVYILLHRIGKRNGLFALFSRNQTITACKYPGAPSIINLKPDTFVNIRLGGLPAGVGKLSLIRAGLILIKNANILPFVPRVAELTSFKDAYHTATKFPVLGHVGRKWYTKYDPQDYFITVDQSNEYFTHLLEVVTVFVMKMARHGTLARSPAIEQCAGSAAANQAVWNQVVESYATNIATAADASLLTMAMKLNVAATGVSSAMDALRILRDPNQAANHDAATQAYIQSNLDIIRDL